MVAACNPLQIDKPEIHDSRHIVEFIKAFEGFRHTPYYDTAGVLTTCYGYTKNVKRFEIRSKDTCEKLLMADLEEFDSYIPDRFQGCQRDALLSFTYNAGPGNLKQLIRNNRSDEVISERMILYYNSGGKKIEGLVKRRLAEQAIFLNCDYTGRP